MEPIDVIMKDVKEHYERCPTEAKSMSDMAKLYALVFLGIRYRENIFREIRRLQ